MFSIRQFTSLAVAVPLFIMKFACLIETPASPTESPLSPIDSINLPAVSPSGFLKTEPELGTVRGWGCDLLESCRSGRRSYHLRLILFH